MELRIKEVAKSKGMDLQTLSKKLGITYQALNARMVGNPSAKAIQEIADAIGCSVHEIIGADKNLTHLYDGNGVWLGLQNK